MRSARLVVLLLVAAGCGARGEPPAAGAQDDDEPVSVTGILLGAEPASVAKALIVSISAGGDLSVRGKPVAIDELDELLARAVTQDDYTVLVIATAGETPPIAEQVVAKARAARLRIAVAPDAACPRCRPPEQRHGIKLDLPQGASHDIDPAVISLVISVRGSGQILAQERPVQLDDLDKLFALAFQQAPQTQVIIEAEQGVQHGIIVAIMEKAKQAGLSRLAIATRGAGAKP